MAKPAIEELVAGTGPELVRGKTWRCMLSVV